MRTVRATVPVLVAAALGLAAVARATMTVRNGDFSTGSAGMPAEWRTDAWARDGVEFSWTQPGATSGSGSAEIRNVTPNDARWCQTVAVEPGVTYRVAVRARTREVGTSASGAHIAIEPRVADSAELRGTQEWQPLEVIARAGDETQWDVCLRLGSYANLNTGAAWFTGVSVTELGTSATTTPTKRTLARLWEWAHASGRGVALPLVGGALLALGLGVGRRHHAS